MTLSPSPKIIFYLFPVPHFVYMLLCKGGRIYTGYATDVQKRFEAHKAGAGAKFTKAFPPQKILKVFSLSTKHDAMRLEYLIKRQKPSVKRECAALPEGVLPTFFTASVGGEPVLSKADGSD